MADYMRTVFPEGLLGTFDSSIFSPVFILILISATVLISCSSSDKGDDSGDSDSGPTDCNEAMTFIFGPDGCFTLRDGDGNVVTPEQLCSGAYEDVAPCYIECYDKKKDCSFLQECLTNECGVGLG